MQNSAVMMVRAAVLLVCLIAVPAAAIWGKQAPEFVKSLLRDYAGGAAKESATTSDASDAPAFRPAFVATATGPASAASTAPLPLPGKEPGSLPTPLDRSTVASQAVHAGINSHVAAANASLQPQSHMSAASAKQMPDRAVATVSHELSVAPEHRPAPTRRGAENARSGELKTTSFPPDYFRSAEMRLRELGASYYLLESLGPGAEQFRFVCKVAGGSPTEQTLTFFAVDRDALTALNDVVGQVESWHSQRGKTVENGTVTGP